MSLSSADDPLLRNDFLDALYSRADPVLSLVHKISSIERDGRPVQGLDRRRQTNLSGLKAIGLLPDSSPVPNNALEMGIELGHSVTIAVVGCGGTGSHLVPTLLQYIASAKLTSTEENPFPSV